MSKPPPLSCVLFVLFAACSNGDEPTDDSPPPGDDDTDDTTPIPDSTTESSGETGTAATGDTAPPVPEFDCESIPVDPIGIRTIQGARGYHGLAFDTQGHIIGSSGDNLMSVTYYGDVSVLVPSMGYLQSMDWLPDGDLVVASGTTNSLTRVVVATGGTGVIASDIAAYGVIVGPNGMIYAADESRVYRIDPATGVKEVFVQPDGNFEPQSLNFSPDFSRFYMTSRFGWALWEMDLDENLEQASAKRHLADFGGGYRDGLAIDYCGNLYVPDFSTNNLYRISPTGQVGLLVNFSSSQYGHSAVFGNGVGGWKHDALYLPQPYNGNKVIEVELGVPSRSWVF